MKKLAILGAIFLGLHSFAQDMVVQNIDQNNILYRGFENKISLDRMEDNNKDYQIETVNCKVSKLDVNESGNTYIVKTNPKARTAKINLVSNGEVIDSESFIVHNLPSPSLFWGSNQSGSTISDSKEICVKYADGIALKSNFKIVSWDCIQDEAKFKGAGSELSQKLLDFTQSMATGELISIQVMVKGEDGITRKTVGSWVK